MHRIVARLAAAAAVALWLCACSARSPELAVGTPHPYTKIQVESGKLTSLNTYLGKHVVLGFWATTCRYSPRMIARLNEFARANGGRNDLLVVAVSIDEAEDYDAYRDRIRVEKFDAVIHAFSGNGVYDEAWQAFRGEALPYVVVLDPAGRVAAAGDDLGDVDHAIPGR